MVGVPLILEFSGGMKKPHPTGILLPQIASHVYLKNKQNITGT